jgi:hypothetical protein
VILLLLACASPEGWTPEAAVVALRQRADRDGDGRLEAGEWDADAPYGPTFARVDADGDGDVSPGELVRLARGVDPAAWLDATARTQPGRRIPVRGAAPVDAPPGTTSPPARPYVQALCADLLAATTCDPACARAAPTARDIDGLGDATLQSDAARALLERLRGLYTRAGLRFPEGL